MGRARDAASGALDQSMTTGVFLSSDRGLGPEVPLAREDSREDAFLAKEKDRLQRRVRKDDKRLKQLKAQRASLKSTYPAYPGYRATQVRKYREQMQDTVAGTRERAQRLRKMTDNLDQLKAGRINRQLGRDEQPGDMKKIEGRPGLLQRLMYRAQR